MKEEFLRERAFDEAWKKILGEFFWDFLDFYFPEVLTEIDQKRGYTFLDQEMKKIMQGSEAKNRRLDKLAKVYSKDNTEIWLLIHIEIQSYYDKDFSLRMFQTSYRIFDLYGKYATSLAILTDNNRNFKPKNLNLKGLGNSQNLFTFDIFKIIECDIDELKKNPNIFAIVTMASIKTHQKDMQERFISKELLTKMLYARGYSKEVVISLHEFLDAIIVLSKDLEKRYNSNIIEHEREKNMPYTITAIKYEQEEIVINMLKDNFSIEQIQKYIPKLSIEEILEIKKEMEKAKK